MALFVKFHRKNRDLAGAAAAGAAFAWDADAVRFGQLVHVGVVAAQFQGRAAFLELDRLASRGGRLGGADGGVAGDAGLLCHLYHTAGPLGVGHDSGQPGADEEIMGPDLKTLPTDEAMVL